MKTPQNSKPVAVVTGGARGIGLEICNTFLKRGYRVAALDIDKVTLAKAESHFNNPDFLAIHCDVSKPMQVSRSIDRIEKKFGRIDSLVNNAGVAIFKPILDVTWQDWRSIMDTNLDGAFWCTQLCAKVMLKNGGGQCGQHRVDLGPEGQHPAGGLWHQQSGHHPPDQTTSRRIGGCWHSRELCRARARGH
jgi:NAD(P)-dependent dehydrogenase (short-subunit alcohol dehydrogenase family)